MIRIILALLLLSIPAYAAELTLNDLPAVLNTLRDCKPSKNWRGTETTICNNERSWASVSGDGEITFFFKGNGGLEATGSGYTIADALRTLAAKLNVMNASGKSAVERMAPLLPTQ